MSTLFAGPFVGEFGFELFGWQGYLRNISKKYDHVIVSSRPKNKILYEDFCDEFVPFDTEQGKCAGWTNYGYKYNGNLHTKYSPDNLIYIDNEGDANSIFNGIEQEFVHYGKKIDGHGMDIIVHARMVVSMNDSYKLSRNWSIDKWNALVAKFISNGLSVGSIGATGFSEYIDGTKNFLDLNLEDLADVLCNSNVAMGPSSGPMHFSTLCKCPQFVWTSNREGIGHQNKENYENKWNPFRTKVCVYEDGGWNPNSEDVYDNFMKFYDSIKK